MLAIEHQSVRRCGRPFLFSLQAVNEPTSNHERRVLLRGQRFAPRLHNVANEFHAWASVVHLSLLIPLR